MVPMVPNGKHMQTCVMWVYSLLYDAASWTSFIKNPSGFMPKPSEWGGGRADKKVVQLTGTIQPM